MSASVAHSSASLPPSCETSAQSVAVKTPRWCYRAMRCSIKTSQMRITATLMRLALRWCADGPHPSKSNWWRSTNNRREEPDSAHRTKKRRAMATMGPHKQGETWLTCPWMRLIDGPRVASLIKEMGELHAFEKVITKWVKNGSFCGHYVSLSKSCSTFRIFAFVNLYRNSWHLLLLWNAPLRCFPNLWYLTKRVRKHCEDIFTRLIVEMRALKKSTACVCI